MDASLGGAEVASNVRSIGHIIHWLDEAVEDLRTDGGDVVHG